MGTQSPCPVAGWARTRLFRQGVVFGGVSELMIDRSLLADAWGEPKEGVREDLGGEYA